MNVKVGDVVELRLPGRDDWLTARCTDAENYEFRIVQAGAFLGAIARPGDYIDVRVYERIAAASDEG